MKNFKVSFLIMLLTSSHNCWAMDPDPAEVHSPHTIAIPAPNDLQLEIDTLIDRIFIRARGEEELEKALYRSLNIQVSEVEQEFTRLLAKAPYNDNLKFYFACFLLHNKRYVEGLTQYSQFLLYGQKSGKLVTDFMDSFKKIAVAGEKLKPFVQKIQDVLRDEKKFIADNNWTHLPKPQQQKRIHNDLLKNATSLLGLVKKLNNYCYDAVFHVIITALNHGRGATATALIERLYGQDPATQDLASPLLIHHYASRFLLENPTTKIQHKLVLMNNQRKATLLYERILDIETGDRHKEYNNLDWIQTYSINFAGLLASSVRPIQSPTTSLKDITETNFSPEDSEKMQKALSCLNKWGSSPSSPLKLNIKFVLQAYLKQYKNALETCRELKNMPLDILEKHRISPEGLGKKYILLLHAAEQTDELDRIYREKIANCLKREEQLADLIRAEKAQAEEEKLKRKKETQQEIEKQKQAKEEKLNRQKETQQDVEQPAQTYIELPVQSSEQKAEKGRVTEETKQPKKKTKGTPAKQPSSALPSIKPVKKSVVYIHDLGLSNASQNTFMEFFAPYTENREPKVTLKQIINFCADLDRNKIPSQNKKRLQKTLDTHRGTSHHKATFIPQDFGLEGEEQMAIITNLIEERPYQVDHLREIFLSLGIVPNDPVLIRKLEAEGRL